MIKVRAKPYGNCGVMEPIKLSKYVEDSLDGSFRDELCVPRDTLGKLRGMVAALTVALVEHGVVKAEDVPGMLGRFEDLQVVEADKDEDHAP